MGYNLLLNGIYWRGYIPFTHQLILTSVPGHPTGPFTHPFAVRTARLGLHNGGINAVRISTDGHTVRAIAIAVYKVGSLTSYKWSYIIPMGRVISSQLPIYKVLILF